MATTMALCIVSLLVLCITISNVNGKPSPHRHRHWKRDLTKVFVMSPQEVQPKKALAGYGAPIKIAANDQAAFENTNMKFEQPARSSVENKYVQGQSFDTNKFDKFDSNNFDPNKYGLNNFDSSKLDANKLDSSKYDTSKFDSNKLEANANKLDSTKLDMAKHGFPAGFSPYRGSELMETPSYNPSTVEDIYKQWGQNHKTSIGIDPDMDRVVQGNDETNLNMPTGTIDNNASPAALSRTNTNVEQLALKYESDKSYSSDNSYNQEYEPGQTEYNSVEHAVGLPEVDGSRKSDVPAENTQNTQSRQDLSWYGEPHPDGDHKHLTDNAIITHTDNSSGFTGVSRYPPVIYANGTRGSARNSTSIQGSDTSAVVDAGLVLPGSEKPLNLQVQVIASRNQSSASPSPPFVGVEQPPKLVAPVVPETPPAPASEEKSIPAVDKPASDKPASGVEYVVPPIIGESSPPVAKAVNDSVVVPESSEAIYPLYTKDNALQATEAIASQQKIAAPLPITAISGAVVESQPAPGPKPQASAPVVAPQPAPSPGIANEPAPVPVVEPKPASVPAVEPKPASVPAVEPQSEQVRAPPKPTPKFPSANAYPVTMVYLGGNQNKIESKLAATQKVSEPVQPQVPAPVASFPLTPVAPQSRLPVATQSSLDVPGPYASQPNTAGTPIKPAAQPYKEPLEPDCLQWTEWSGCSKTCGSGSQYRERNCTEVYNNKTSHYNEGQGQYCNENPCPFECVYNNGLYSSGTSFDIGDCITCHCNNGSLSCEKNPGECPAANKTAPPGTCEHPTTGGNGNGGCCVFPFISNGQSHQSCIIQPGQEYWCSVTFNFDKDGNWGFCGGCKKPPCPPSTTKAPPPVSTRQPVTTKAATNVTTPSSTLSTTPATTDIECTPWTQWSACSRTCGYGYKQRFRNCTVDGKRVLPFYETKQCYEVDCPAVCDAWSSWGTCSKSCGGGSQERIRNCTLTDGITETTSPFFESRVCNAEPCPPVCKEWTSWSNCSKQCGGGVQNRERNCSQEDKGKNDTYNEGQGQICNDFPCDRVCQKWTKWGECSKTCGGGTQYRERYCSVDNGGKSETHHEGEYHVCNAQPCPPVCQPWSQWSQCTRTCGGGTQYRERNCSQEDKGKNSTFNEGEGQVCNDKPCPTAPVVDLCAGVKCEFYAVCKVLANQSAVCVCDEICTLEYEPLCGSDDKTYANECVMRAEACEIKKMITVKHKGECDATKAVGPPLPPTTKPPTQATLPNCKEKRTEALMLGGGQLPMPGQFVPTCTDDGYYNSVQCHPSTGFCWCVDVENGMKIPNTEVRFKTPTCPQSHIITSQNCASWGSWSECSKTCGGGERARVQACRQPDGTVNINAQEELCNQRPCTPVCGQWSAFTECTVSCGGGFMERWRTCDGDIQAENQTCNSFPCPTLPKVPETTPKAITVTTPVTPAPGPGPGPLIGVPVSPAPAPGPLPETTPAPPTEPECGPWSNWSDCSATCNGMQTRVRHCKNATHESEELQAKPCNTQPCQPTVKPLTTEEVQTTVPPTTPTGPSCSEWSKWSQCTRTCGGGYQDRFRTCDKFQQEFESRICNTHFCDLTTATPPIANTTATPSNTTATPPPTTTPQQSSTSRPGPEPVPTTRQPLGPLPIPECLLAYLSFDKVDKERMIVYDEGPLHNDALFEGKVHFVEGNFSCGFAAKLEDGEIVFDGTKFSPKPENGVTIAAWIYVDSNTQRQKLFSTRAEGTGSDNYFMELESGKIRWYHLSPNGGTVFLMTTDSLIPEKTWVHVAGSYDVNTGNARFFVNSEEIQLSKGKGPLTTNWQEWAGIGSNALESRFKGLIDEFYIFNCSLKDEQVRQVADTCKIREGNGCPSPLLGVCPPCENCTSAGKLATTPSPHTAKPGEVPSREKSSLYSSNLGQYAFENGQQYYDYRYGSIAKPSEASQNLVRAYRHASPSQNLVRADRHASPSQNLVRAYRHASPRRTLVRTYRDVSAFPWSKVRAGYNKR